ncbi:hypothetical protein [Pseudoalteromonas sp. MSK9-3]|uniref:hypothetical protein n=1 Tax=Pseudoalteromonas sp. MSK9-3 TaxID=1897633 RepID=UPI001602ABCC|nr:hypothetical protein [Pseudoalteromonas sp. MSK9-3]
MKLVIKKKHLKSLQNNQLEQQKTNKVAGGTAAPGTYSREALLCRWTKDFC